MPTSLGLVARATLLVALAAPAAAQQLRMNVPLRGELTASDPRDRDGTRYDVIHVSGARGQTVRMLVESSAFAPYAILTTPDGRVVADAYGGIGNRRQLVTVTFPAEATYHLRIISQTDELGPYRVEMAVPRSSTHPRELISGGTIVDSLTVGDLLTSLSTAFDVYEIAAFPGDRLAVELESSAGFGLLIADDGETVFSSTGSQANTRHVLQPSAETVYRIMVAERTGGRGAYRLSVRQLGANK